MANSLRMAVIGVGHLGKAHARILSELPGVDLVGVADVNPEQAEIVARQHNTQAFSDYWPLLNLVDAVSVVVPTIHHYQVASEFLQRGIHVLVEKPISHDLNQANELVELAQRNDTTLQVGHIERFNPAFEELQSRRCQPKFLLCERLAPYTGRSTDIGAVLDLMIHDLDLVLALVQSDLVAVDALGVSIFGGHEDVANARLQFANGSVATLTASRVNPTLIRTMRLWAPEGFVRVDFSNRDLTLMQPTEFLRYHGLDPTKLQPAERTRLRDEIFRKYFESATIQTPHADQLTAELKHFLHCIHNRATPRVSGIAGRNALAVATKILDKIHAHRWTQVADGPQGPNNLPLPLGPLFKPSQREDAA